MIRPKKKIQFLKIWYEKEDFDYIKKRRRRRFILVTHPRIKNVFFCCRCCCCCCCIRVGEWTRAVVFISSKRLQHRSFPRSSKWSSSFFSPQLLLCGCLFPIHKFSYSDVSYTTSASVMGEISLIELLSLNKDTKIHHRRTLGRLGSDSLKNLFD